MKRYDFLVIGGGIVGLTLARALLRKKAGTVCVLEKENQLGLHASGRNSGVVHAGIYYKPGSLKSQLCVSGARLMREYADENNIPIRRSGKVIVAPDSKSVSQIDALFERATANGVRVEKISAGDLKKIEPYARTFEKALYSPDTAVIDSQAVLNCLGKEILQDGATIQKSAEALKIDPKNSMVDTALGKINYGHLINAAGLHADRIAHAMGAGKRYRIVPFKGMYKKIRPETAKNFRSLIYPVPDQNMPFLGVHITRTIDDQVFAGPTALAAFGREHYGIWKGLNLKDIFAITGDLMVLSLQNRDGFRRMVGEEFSKLSASGFLKHVQALSPSLEGRDLLPCQKVGLRAQLVDVVERKLVMDFIVENGERSTHVLNAVSPAFTGSLAFAEMLADRILSQKSQETAPVRP